jgi:8-oxo-dGTP pyrophosphatase MutT (NUDIX family)
VDEIAAVFVLRADGAALLQHRDDKPGLRDAGKWVPPGGHSDDGESIEQCARRELREETEYVCGELHRLATLDWTDCTLHVFWTRYDDAQPVHCREGQDLKFVKREEACYYAIPSRLISVWDQALVKINE